MRQRLNAHLIGAAQRPQDREATDPASALAAWLAATWQQVLGRPGIGPADDFFELGGHSLKAAIVLGRVRKALGVPITLRDLFEHPTCAGLAGVLEARCREQGRDVHDLPAVVPPVPAAEGVAQTHRAASHARQQQAGPSTQRETTDLPPSPLSSGERRLWFEQQRWPESPAYNEPFASRLKGPLDLARLQGGLDQLARRHEILRTSYHEVQGQPFRRVEEAGRLRIRVEEVAGGSGGELEGDLQRRLEAEAMRPFDLAAAPLCRVVLFRVSDTEHILLLVLHHIICDEWTVQLLLREWSALYERGGSDAKPPPAAYARFAMEQQQYAGGTLCEKDMAYWREHLGDARGELNLPIRRTKAPTASWRGDEIRDVLPPETAGRLRAIGRECGTTLFPTLLAAYRVLLWKYSRQECFIIGTPVTQRSSAEFEETAGFFLNMLPIRVDIDGHESFRKLVQRANRRLCEAYEHQDAPFETMVRRLRGAGRPEDNPLCQTVLVLRDGPDPCLQIRGVAASAIRLSTRSSKFPLTLTFIETRAGLEAIFEYRTEEFDEGTMRSLLRHLRNLLGAVTATPDERLSRLSMLDADERQLVIRSFNATQRPYPQDQSLHGLFERQVGRQPDAPAVIDGAASLTYGDVNGRANRIAQRLQDCGVNRGQTVAIAVDRSADYVSGVLGILKAGACYLPLDPTYPSYRLNYLLEDSDAAAVLTHRDDLAGVRGGRVPVLPLETSQDDRPGGAALHRRVETAPEDTAYIMYTSGSTGSPKGVMVPHRAVVRLVCGPTYVPFSEKLRVLLLAPTCFDASTFELWGALLHGGTCVVYASRIVDFEDLGRVLEEQRVNCLWLTAGLFNAIIDEHPQALRGVRYLLTGGEALSVPHVRRALDRLPDTHLINGYGPTEATTFTCTHAIPRDLDPQARSVPIGRPIANTSVYVLDREGEPAGVGVPGELYIGGDGLASGYLKAPALNAEKFVPDRFGGSPGRRLFRTGDLGRWLADGSLEFLGRLDGQVKLRGFRIEVGEIETVLQGHPSVGQAAVVLESDQAGHGRLVAYLAPSAGARAPTDDLRRHLRGILPDYMVPSVFIWMDRLPLTGNGKVDRMALRSAEAAAAPAGCAPRTDVERELAAIWSNVLGRERIGIRDNFFEIGGHSLSVVELCAQIRKRFDVVISPADLMGRPTIEEEAEFLSHRGDRPKRQLVVPLKTTGRRPPLFCCPGLRGHAANFSELARHLVETPCYGLDSPGADDRSGTYDSVEHLAEALLDDIRRVQSRGPYHLGGFSLGGLVAFEIARQMEAAGESVNLLVLWESFPPSAIGQSCSVRQRLRVHRCRMRKLSVPRQLAYVSNIVSGACHKRVAEWLGLPSARLRAPDRMNREAACAYGPTPIRCPAVLFCSDTAMEYQEALGIDLARAWEPFLPAGFRVIRVSAAHLEVLKEPAVRILAEETERLLAATDCQHAAERQT